MRLMMKANQLDGAAHFLGRTATRAAVASVVRRWRMHRFRPDGRLLLVVERAQGAWSAAATSSPAVTEHEPIS